MGCRLSKPAHRKHKKNTHSRDICTSVSCSTKAVQVGDGDINREIHDSARHDDSVKVIAVRTRLKEENLSTLRSHRESQYDDCVKKSAKRHRNSKQTLPSVNKDGKDNERMDITKLKKVPRCHPQRKDIHIVGDIDGEYCIHVDLSSCPCSPRKEDDIESNCTDLSGLTRRSGLFSHGDIEQIIPGISLQQDRNNFNRGFQAVCSDEDGPFGGDLRRLTDPAMTTFISPFFRKQNVYNIPSLRRSNSSLNAPSSLDEANDFRYRPRYSDASRNIVTEGSMCKEVPNTDAAEYTVSRQTTISDCNRIKNLSTTSQIQSYRSNDRTNSKKRPEMSLPISLDCGVSYLSKRIDRTGGINTINLAQSKHGTRSPCVNERVNNTKMQNSQDEDRGTCGNDAQHESEEQVFREHLTKTQLPIRYDSKKGVPCKRNSPECVTNPSRIYTEPACKKLPRIELEESRYSADNSDLSRIRQNKYISNVPLFGRTNARCMSLQTSDKPLEASEWTETGECDSQSTSQELPDSTSLHHSKNTISRHFGPRSPSIVRKKDRGVTSLESRHDDGRLATRSSASTVRLQSPKEQSITTSPLSKTYCFNDRIRRRLNVATKCSNKNGSAVRAENVIDCDIRNTKHRLVTDEKLNRSEIARNSDVSETIDTPDSSSETTVSETVSDSEEEDELIDGNVSSSYAEYTSAQEVCDKQGTDYSDCDDSVKAIDDYWSAWLKRETMNGGQR